MGSAAIAAAVACGGLWAGAASAVGNPETPQVSALGSGPKDRIVYSAFSNAKPGIYVVHADGSARTRLTTTKSDRDPMLSPDGTRIVFTRGAQGKGDVFVMNVDGSALRRLTGGFDAAYSPDGRTIVFQRDTTGATSLMDADGTNQRKIPGVGGGRHPSFSPDGRRIVIAIDRDEASPDLFVHNADGSGGLTNLTDTGAAERDPTFSPDGEKIIFNRSGSAEICAGTCGLVVMNADGSDEVYLNPDASDPALADGRFSPDGRSILYRQGNDLFQANLDGSDRRRLTSSAMTEYEPFWGVGSSCNPGASAPRGYRLKTGSSGKDTLAGTPGMDLIRGLGGNDEIRGGSGNDILCGGGGDDRIFGGPGRDRLVGASGDDFLNGGDGRDELDGGSGRDELRR